MKTTLLKLTILIAFSISAISVTGQTNCLNARYKLDGTATDYGGKNLNGTLTGTTPTTGHLSAANSALYFNGSSDKVNFPDDFDFPLRTISLWLKADTFTTATNTVYTSDHANILYGSTTISVEKYNGTNEIGFISSTNVSRYNNQVATNIWYHVAIVVSANYMKSFINGALVDSMSYSSYLHSNDGDNFAKLGATRKNDRYFKGSIDEVKIFDCALKNSQIDSLYHIDLGINEISQTNHFSIFPNPFVSQTTLQTDKFLKEATLIVYNLEGQAVKQIDHLSGKTIILQRNNLPGGLYFIRVTQDNKTFSADKLIITDN